MDDFRLTPDGELLLEKNNELQTVNTYELNEQIALCRIKSVSTNWFYDNVGADLESCIGKVWNDDLQKKIERSIIGSLSKDRLFSKDDVFVHSSFENNITKIKVYLKRNKHTSGVVYVDLDHVFGVNCRIGEEE